MSETVLVTGAAGFVGRTLVGALRDQGLRVVAMVRDKHRPLDFGDATAYGDVTDRNFCQRVIADYSIGTIYHLAAESIVSACAEDPLSALHIAVMGTGALLTAVRDSGRPIKVVVSTSDKVFGSAPPPYTEETPLDARHAYEVSKACQDLVARMFASNYGVDVRVVRAVNIYGPGDPNDTRLIPQTIQRLLRGEPPLLHAGAGDMRRQYVYVEDVVRAFVTVAERGLAGEAYCAGSKAPPISALEVIRACCDACGVPFQPPAVQARDERFHEIASQAVDDAKLRGLGWAPSVPFPDGIRQTIEWYKARVK